jgi:hypothetical protein
MPTTGWTGAPGGARTGTRRSAWLVVALASLLAGCAVDQGFLSVATTRQGNFDLRGVDVSALSVRRDVEASDTRVTSILFIPTFDGPRLERAVEEALVLGRGDVMARVHVRSIDWWFLVGVSTLHVRGDVIDLSGAQVP